MSAGTEELVAEVHGLPLLRRLDEVVELQQAVGQVYLRFSRGPESDASEVSRDKESGCVLPGLSTNPVTPEPWWHREPREWAARQLCQYAHLWERDSDRCGWLLTGVIVGRGPDSEPLLGETTPLAVLAPSCLREAQRVYTEAFSPGRV
ncbi:DUF6098 family protein [Georgenia sp. 10Sc9-8]|uniref:DUF6098 family protein n=1 Tax=Georgenia halotolerans TaxID=3028317 RepID=A0ABT5TVR8_9MICO|nr:DUF6098 family protein [Georgenia halotolerans]